MLLHTSVRDAAKELAAQDAGNSARKKYVYSTSSGRTLYDPEPTPECSVVAFDGRVVPRGEL
ncbi:MAG: hypothetical protein K0U76_10820 [Actinomycetia bacterium]|nr:hypothetical protein [Actinomycetes bacterium]MCH9762587.1 hypothetical protein [Actinomycetes bacterium]